MLTVELRFFGGTLELRASRDRTPRIDLPADGAADGAANANANANANADAGSGVDAGSVVDDVAALELPRLSRDERTACWRAPALAYAEVLLVLSRLQKQGVVVVVDHARRYEELTLTAHAPPARRDYQEEALQAWKKHRGRGVVVLPTGAGKTEVALAAIADRQRSTLVVAPTLDLVRQWHQALTDRFRVDIGVVGGGEHTVLPLTVTTYDSAWAHMEHFGNRFGLVVFDECHHLVSESYALAARLCLAPYRLGLSATPERTDGRDALLDELIGPIVARREIDELEGTFLAGYDVVAIDVELSPAERAAWEQARALYKGFLLDNRISMGGTDGWSRFLRLAAKSREGRQAFAAWRLQRRLAFAAEQKLHHVGEILERHKDSRTLVFSDDNATAYEVSRRFLVPVISHQTKVKERSVLLKAFSDGSLPVLATSRVLNEGIDVPDAQVAVILSGSGSTREHVQRLGRVLRPRPGKRAVLYELVSQNTGETYTSERRRDHVAYR